MPVTDADKPRLLIVDDDPDIRANLADIFSDFGYEVDRAADGPSAMKLIEQKRFDAAVLDLKMPGMDGLELYRRLKRVQPATVAIIVTAYASSDTAREAIAAGAWELMSKPVDLPRLVPMIEESLKQPMVIVVDDDHDLCDTLWDVLRQHRCRACVAHDVDSAMRRLEEREYDVALIDMKLPTGSGADVLAAVRSKQPQARAILITGYPGDITQRDLAGQHQQPDAIFTKPLNISAVFQAMKLTAPAGKDDAPSQ